MKPIFFFIVSLTIFLEACNNTKVTDAVKESFAKKYPGLSPKWEKDEGNYEAVFEMNQQQVSAIFEPTGALLETEVVIRIKDLPVAARSYIDKNYPGISIRETSIIILSDQTVQYEVLMKKKELLFDDNGNFIKEVND